MLGPPKSKQPQHAHTSSSASLNEAVGNMGAPYIRTQNDQGYFRPQRPRPQFDMNLRDLFPEEAHDRSTLSRNLSRWSFANPTSAGNPGLTPQNTMYTDISANPSPSQSNFPQQQIQQPPLPHPISAPYGQNFQLPTPVPIEFAQQQQQTSTSDEPMSGYNDPSGGGSGFNPTEGGTGYNTTGASGDGFNTTGAGYMGFGSDMDSLLGDTTAQYTGHPGLALGFDSEHDWSEGAGVDLFDGFFFGGTYGGLGSAGGL
jgi:hypothetical protein